MWAQMIKWRLRPGAAGRIGEVMEAVRAVEQPDSGLLRTLTLQDQHDDGVVYTMVIFESEEKARAREADPRRTEGMAKARAIMAEVFDGPPEFTDLDVIDDRVP